MPGRLLRTICTGALAGVLATTAAPTEPALTGTAAAAPADEGESSVAGLLTRLRTLYQETERATEAYNRADEALKRQTADTRRTDTALAAARQALTRGRDEAGRLARQQYQGRSELSPYLSLLLAPDPRHALDENHLVTRAARERAAVISRLEAAEKKAATLATASRTALTRRQGLLAAQQKQRAAVRTKLDEVEKLLASLSPAQLARLTSLETTQTAGAQSELLGSGALDSTLMPSEEGATALRFAARQIGKPYEWGAEGPDTYDCSGLTQQSWAAAGRELPRTSQEQWQTLPHVPLTALRPGDLVVYFPDATHVALYLGDGLVIHAPRPGARVKVSPLAANPVLGAVRPDPDALPLKAFTPPELPAGATDGSDEGFSGTDQPPTGTGTQNGTESETESGTGTGADVGADVGAAEAGNESGAAPESGAESGAAPEGGAGTASGNEGGSAAATEGG